jgi:RimJ/RimL family protein N-acetyltransferase
MNYEIKLSLVKEENIEFLYELLKERLNYSNDLDKINLEEFPTFKQHSKMIYNFLENNSFNNYQKWYIILISNRKYTEEKVGSIVLKKDGEWGYHVLKKFWNSGIGQEALRQLMGLHKDCKFIAKIKPDNKRAIHIAEKSGHKLTEITYVKEPQIMDES